MLDLRAGDCLDILEHIPDKSVELILADLPYGTTKCKWDVKIDLDKLWPHYKRISCGAILLFAQTPFDKVVGASNLPMLRYEWVWEKTHATGHLNARRMPMKAHENILVFYSKLPKYNPQKTHGHKRKTATKRGDATQVYGGQSFDEIAYDSTERFPRSVIQFPSDKQKFQLHSTQKPIDLCRYFIRTYTDPGDTVLDNVMGSGSTGVAAVMEGREFIGIEKSPEYFALAKSRISQFSKTNL